jgi:hypothetical protein
VSCPNLEKASMLCSIAKDIKEHAADKSVIWNFFGTLYSC